MKQPHLNIGEVAMDLLLALLEGKELEQREILLRSTLIVRDFVQTYEEDV